MSVYPYMYMSMWLLRKARRGCWIPRDRFTVNCEFPDLDAEN